MTSYPNVTKVITSAQYWLWNVKQVQYVPNEARMFPPAWLVSRPEVCSVYETRYGRKYKALDYQVKGKLPKTMVDDR